MSLQGDNLVMDKIKTSCLFCRTTIMCPSDQSWNADTQEGKNKSEIIKILCHRANVPVAKIPMNFSSEAFPFCSPCEERVLSIWENDVKIKSAETEIALAMEYLQKRVAEAEIIKGLLSKSVPTQDNKFYALSDQILQDYRFVLFNQFQMKNGLIEEEAPANGAQVTPPPDSYPSTSTSVADAPFSQGRADLGHSFCEETLAVNTLDETEMIGENPVQDPAADNTGHLEETGPPLQLETERESTRIPTPELGTQTRRSRRRCVPKLTEKIQESKQSTGKKRIKDNAKHPRKRASYYNKNLTCDICGRPVKGVLNNLMIHKFSHKNNEERLAAIAANEQGCSSRKLGPKT